MTNENDTIAAIATAPGESGIAIVRISGPASMDIADKIMRCTEPSPSKREGNTFVRGFIKSADEENDSCDLDEVIMLLYRAPKSYTREDVVEIQGHGGYQCAKRILRTILEAGARAAEPGEFTKRAFLNGRIDLLQAEAVADLIKAKSDRAASAAIEQLEGGLSGSISTIYDNLLVVCADLESSLDFPDEDLPVKEIEGSRVQLDGIIAKLDELLSTWNEGRLLREGALVVISGKPNAGKSTLLNKILGVERAIVTSMPGTTRDTIEEQFVVDGIPVRIVDTAGLRETDCQIEQEGVRRAESHIAKADIHLHVIDASEAPDEDALKLPDGLTVDNALLVLNKVDLGQKTAGADFDGYKTLSCSLTKDSPSEEILKMMADILHTAPEPLQHAVISERHHNVIRSVQNELNAARSAMQEAGNEGIVLSAANLRSAMEQLGSLTGRLYDSDLLDSIFSRFCIGK